MGSLKPARLRRPGGKRIDGIEGMTRGANGGAIVIAAAPEGAWIVFAGMARPPQPILRWLPSMDLARSLAIAMHESHGWPIKEGYAGPTEPAE